MLDFQGIRTYGLSSCTKSALAIYNCTCCSPVIFCCGNFSPFYLTALFATIAHIKQKNLLMQVFIPNVGHQERADETGMPLPKWITERLLNIHNHWIRIEEQNDLVYTVSQSVESRTQASWTFVLRLNPSVLPSLYFCIRFRRQWECLWWSSML